MTTTPETPALPGDLTDERIERAARAAWELREDIGSWANASESWKARTRGQMRAAFAAAGVAPEVDGSTSDGHHTFDELYAYRMAYHAHAASGWAAAGIPVVKSRRHSDGELCFGGGWFIVVADLPTGQVSNHYREEHWDLFKVPAVTDPPEYDGHTPSDALQRLLEADLDLDAERSELARKGRRYADWKREKGDAGTADIITWLVDAIEIPRIGPAPHETMYVRCDCVPNLGPAHCHDCDVPYSECRARVAPVTPSTEASAEDLLGMICLAAEEPQGNADDVLRDIVLLISDHWEQTDTDEEIDRARELRDSLAAGVATVTSSDTPPERDATPDEAFELGRVAGYDEAMAERTTPSPDREKVIERKLRELGVEDGIDMRDAVAFVLSLAAPATSAPDRNRGFRKLEAVQGILAAAQTAVTDAVRELSLAAAALAVPPVVNEAKLAEFIAEELMTDDGVSEGWSWQKVGATARRIAKFAVAERQREWLGEA